MIALFYTDIVEIVGSMVGVAYYSLYIYNCIPNLSYGGHPLIKAPRPDKRDLTVAPKQECLKHYWKSINLGLAGFYNHNNRAYYILGQLLKPQ